MLKRTLKLPAVRSRGLWRFMAVLLFTTFLTSAVTIPALADMTPSSSFQMLAYCSGSSSVAQVTVTGYTPGDNAFGVGIDPGTTIGSGSGAVNFSGSSTKFTFSTAATPPGRYLTEAIDDTTGNFVPSSNLVPYYNTPNQYWYTVPSCPGGAPQIQLNQVTFVGMATTPDFGGYWLAKSNGTVEAKGDAKSYGDASSTPLNSPIVNMAVTPDGKGYYLLGADGGVFSYGDAKFYGSTGNIRLNKPALGMSVTPDGKGYWFVASDGGIFAFGDAKFYGSMGGRPLNKPVVGMATDYSTGGYWLAASDGGIFSFNAPFYGSTGNIRLLEPVVGMAVTSDDRGYWFVAADGGVFNYGDAKFFGSAAGSGFGPGFGATSIVGIAPYGDAGYYLLKSSGGVLDFGDARSYGDGS